jgi:hypothetical protein
LAAFCWCGRCSTTCTRRIFLSGYNTLKNNRFSLDINKRAGLYLIGIKPALLFISKENTYAKNSY